MEYQRPCVSILFLNLFGNTCLINESPEKLNCKKKEFFLAIFHWEIKSISAGFHVWLHEGIFMQSYLSTYRQSKDYSNDQIIFRTDFMCWTISPHRCILDQVSPSCKYGRSFMHSHVTTWRDFRKKWRLMVIDACTTHVEWNLSVFSKLHSKLLENDDDAFSSKYC